MTAHVHHSARRSPVRAVGRPVAAAPAPSLLRLSAVQRLAGAVLISLVLWGLVWWAMQA